MAETARPLLTKYVVLSEEYYPRLSQMVPSLWMEYPAGDDMYCLGWSEVMSPL